MLFCELNQSKCKTYLVVCEDSRRAALVDPVRERFDRYLSLLAYKGLRLDYAIDTHTHADHRTACFDLKELLGVPLVMHRQAPAPKVDIHLADGESLMVGKIAIKVLHTPGHTPDSISLLFGGRVLTGDNLLIGGTGRTDFPGGDPGAQYDSITGKLFALPDETLVFPAHDYRGNAHSTIGEEKRLNPRLVGKTREDYIETMNNLTLALPDKIQEVLQPNQTALDDDRIAFPSLTQLNQVHQLTPHELQALLRAPARPLLLDVREEEEFHGELGHIPNSRLIPLNQLSARAGELGGWKDKPVVAICRAGVRSATAAAILIGLGFTQVSNLKGGMLEWTDRDFPIDR
jgi:glyoxylase-like metal-dependent hydrolase (beta-lactamase superfamily II)/rhodanese-related sulfurtransferase